MIKRMIKLASVTCLLLIACQINPNTDKADNKHTQLVETQNEAKVTDIPFTLAKNYFVNNTVEKLDNPKIETAKTFNKIFGMATTMGKDGKPTEIDFDKKYVIAVILPETDLMTSIYPISLQKDENGKITLTYKTVVGEKQSYRTRPSFEIIVDRTENGSIELREQK
ncbi:MAG: hypothetical protein ACK5UI_02890 [Bacteroidota bacterium]